MRPIALFCMWFRVVYPDGLIMKAYREMPRMPQAILGYQQPYRRAGRGGAGRVGGVAWWFASFTRRMGEMLAATETHPPGPDKRDRSHRVIDPVPTPADLGLTKRESAEAQAELESDKTKRVRAKLAVDAREIKAGRKEPILSEDVCDKINPKTDTPKKHNPFLARNTRHRRVRHSQGSGEESACF